MERGNKTGKLWQKILPCFLLLVFLTGLLGACVRTGDAAASLTAAATVAAQSSESKAFSIEKEGHYTSKEEVALYIHTYGELPSNYISKKEAEKQGWDAQAGNLDEVLPGMSIGGSRFGNREGLLPEAEGRQYYECDIDYTGGFRNAKRLVYSDDGLIFYTEDHYKSFELLYGEEKP